MATNTRYRRRAVAAAQPEAAVRAFAAGDWLGLHRALGLRPWQRSPLDASSDEVPPDWLGDRGSADFLEAQRLRLELERTLARGRG